MILPLSVSDFAARVYLPHHPSISPTWRAEILRTARLIEEWSGEPLSIGELTDDLIADWLLMSSGRWSAKTLNNRRMTILTLWRFAHRKDHHAGLPRDVPRWPEIQRVPEAWTLEEIERLLVTCSRLVGRVGQVPASCWWPALLLTLYWSGARISTVLAIEPADFNPAEGYVVARHTKNRREKLYPLHAQVVEAIARIFDPAAPRLFVWPYCRRQLWAQFRKLVVKAGLSIGKGGMQLFHRLRRSNLSYCAVADVRIAQRQADHSSEALTRARYIDPRIAPERSAVDVLPVPRFHAA